MLRLNLFANDWSITESYGRLMREIGDSIERLQLASVNRIGYGTPQKTIVPVFGGILSGHPTSFQVMSTLASLGPRLALTMFESNSIPDTWAAPLNACGRVVVPSKWLVKVFQVGGVTVPIHVVPLGISRAFTYAPRVGGDKPFRILAIGDRGKRKGSDVAMFAFIKAFGDDPNVELVIKARHYPYHISNENIRLILDDYTDEEMAALYQSADLMVFPTRGEGFGLPPREAAATGALVIATDFAGTADDLPQWGLPLTHEMETAWQGVERFADTGEWAAPNVDQLASLMRWARALPVGIRNEMGRHYATNARSLYDWDVCAKQVFDLWMEVVNEVQHGNARPA